MAKYQNLFKSLIFIAFTLLFLVNPINSQCSFGYTELTFKVVDINNNVWTACILNEQYVNDCALYKAPALTLYSNYSIVTIGQLQCTVCTKTVSPFIAKVNIGSNRYQHFCIDYKYYVQRCQQYVRNIDQSTLTQFYECLKCSVTTPFLILKNYTTYTTTMQVSSGFICADNKAINCSYQTSISSLEKDPISGAFLWMNRRICQACDYGFRLNSYSTYCIPFVQMCQSYTLMKCSRCINGYVLAGQRCVFLPQFCASIDQQTGLCNGCTPGYSLSSNYQCVPFTICNSQQYRDIYGNCRQGNVNNCNNYDEYGNCYGCRDGYQLNRYRTTCSLTSENNPSCPPGNQMVKYGLFGRRCIQFDINCDDRTGLAQNGCIQCRNGYYLWRNKCYKAWY